MVSGAPADVCECVPRTRNASPKVFRPAQASWQERLDYLARFITKLRGGHSGTLLFLGCDQPAVFGIGFGSRFRARAPKSVA